METLAITTSAMPRWTLTEKLAPGPDRRFPTAALLNSPREPRPDGKVGFLVLFISRIAPPPQDPAAPAALVSHVSVLRFSNLFLFVFGKAGINSRSERTVK
jgi:hypothetical protein